MADDSAKSVGKKVPKGSDRKSFSGQPFDELEHFVNKDDQCIFCKTWKPKSGEPKALLLILPSCTQHSEWFSELAETMVELGILVFSHDYVGHGESEGHRCHVDEYELLLRDIRHHIQIMKSEYPDLPVYIFGHAMGGGLAIILAGENPELCNGLILSSPLIISKVIPTGPKVFFMKAASLIMPQMEVVSVDRTMLTRKLEMVEKYKNDAKIHQGPIKLKMALQLVRVLERAQELLPDLSKPVLVLHGDQSKITDISGSEELMKVAKSEDKTLKVYEGAYQELLHEIDDVPQRVLNEIKEWLQKHMSK